VYCAGQHLQNLASVSLSSRLQFCEGRGGVEIILKCVVLIDADAPPISYVWLNNPGVCYLRTELMRNCLVIDIAAVNDLRFKQKRQVTHRSWARLFLLDERQCFVDTIHRNVDREEAQLVD